MNLQLTLQLNRIRPSSPMDEEQSIGSGDADSVGSSGSAGMANFGRTPSPVCFYLLILAKPNHLGTLTSQVSGGHSTTVAIYHLGIIQLAPP